MKRQRKTMDFQELRRLEFCNSKRLPLFIEINGSRLLWVGIGWVNEGKAQGDEVLIIEKPAGGAKAESSGKRRRPSDGGSRSRHAVPGGRRQ